MTVLPSDVAAGLEAAGRAIMPDMPEQAVMVPAPGSPRTMLFVTVNEHEHIRRAGAPRPVITNIGILDTLLALPHGMPVPWMSLTESQCGDASAAETAHQAVTSEHRGEGDTFVIEFIRLAVRPVTVHLALVPGRKPRQTVHAATRYAPFCARAALLPHPPRDPGLLAEADFWGVGVAHCPLTPDGSLGHAAPEVLAAPSPWKRMRHSPAGWAFEERAYHQVLRADRTAAAAS